MSVENVVNDFVFRIEELPDKYRLHNVRYRDGFYVVDWTKNFLRNGEKYTQTRWIDLTKNEEITLPDAPLTYASMNAIANHNGQPELTQKLKQYFKEKLNTNPNRLHTSSKAICTPEGNDSIIHRTGYKDQYTSQKLDLVGSDEWIQKDCGFEKEMKAILNCEDCSEIEKTITKITGFKPYLYRLISRPSTKIELAVVLGVVDGDGFSIDVYNVINGNRPALGVVPVVAAPQKISLQKGIDIEEKLSHNSISDINTSQFYKYVPEVCREDFEIELKQYLNNLVRK